MSALFLPLALLASHLSLCPLSRSRVPSTRHEGIQIFALLTGSPRSLFRACRLTTAAEVEDKAACAAAMQ
eukprot:606033-Pleurochrysis_carterae.AAC.1